MRLRDGCVRFSELMIVFILLFSISICGCTKIINNCCQGGKEGGRNGPWPSGKFMGTVKNQSGAGIPGAQMLFEGPQTHTRNRNSNGGYQTLDLIPGTYKITVTAFGYKPKIEEGVELPATTVVKNYILEPQ